MQDPIQSHILRDADTELKVLSLGCAIQSWKVGGREVTLGYADAETYRTNPMSMGIVVGRVANRISGAKFTLNDEVWHLPKNSGRNCLHGGPGGFGRRNWRMHPEGSRSVKLSLVSDHLDQGFPGRLACDVRISLKGNRVTWDMSAHPDRETPVNLAQHVYFNLMGDGNIREHKLKIKASEVMPTNDELLPTGALVNVSNTKYDFRKMRRISEADPEKLGYDLNFILKPAQDALAELVAPDGTLLQLWTDRPGLQIYTSNTLSAKAPALEGTAHSRFAAICLEAQDFPDAMNRAGFGSIICSPERPYRQITQVEINR